MKPLFLIIFLIFSGSVSIAQVNDKRSNCDSAKTNSEMSICSKKVLEQTRIDYDIVLKEVYSCMDKLISDDKTDRSQILAEFPEHKFKNETDYSKLKQMLVQSDMLFRSYAQNESNIEGEFIGNGMERSYRVNMLLSGLYSVRINDLKSILEMHCN